MQPAGAGPPLPLELVAPLPLELAAPLPLELAALLLLELPAPAPLALAVPPLLALPAPAPLDPDDACASSSLLEHAGAAAKDAIAAMKTHRTGS
ncbi:hypothetical protein WMF45_18505 [Sorangium sp. So ce448]|uniref:hypothetical protein n=1 Tax=Sorangium sp. So ce448 TaxID=3133314 RepID=UPI003F5E4A17